jgi:hypothetical protein
MDCRGKRQFADPRTELEKRDRTMSRARTSAKPSRQLDFDPLVDAMNITVVNLDADVALNGNVPSYPQYLEAAAAAVY